MMRNRNVFVAMKRAANTLMRRGFTNLLSLECRAIDTPKIATPHRKR